MSQKTNDLFGIIHCLWHHTPKQPKRKVIVLTIFDDNKGRNKIHF